MPDPTISDSEKLHKLGERIRRRLDAQRPAKEIRAARFQEYIRQEHERERKTVQPPTPTPTKTKERKPNEPER
jgi:hypothetical protein